MLYAYTLVYLPFTSSLTCVKWQMAVSSIITLTFQALNLCITAIHCTFFGCGWLLARTIDFSRLVSATTTDFQASFRTCSPKQSIIQNEFLRTHLLTSKAQRCREVLIHRGSSLSGLLEDPLSILPLRCLVSPDSFLPFSLYPFLLRTLLFLYPFALSTFTFVLSSSSSL